MGWVGLACTLEAGGEEGHVFGVEVELLDFFDSAKQETRALGHCQWDQKVYDSLPFKRGQL